MRLTMTWDVHVDYSLNPGPWAATAEWAERIRKATNDMPNGHIELELLEEVIELVPVAITTTDEPQQE